MTMRWPIAEVARMSRVTSRTLRHYDEIGLLTPAYVADTGYRFYEQEQLLRLQRILLLRELGLGLAAIADVLDGIGDEIAALRAHEQWLHSERDRLGRLADTVSRTIRQRTRGETMTAHEMFEGFADRRAELEDYLVDKYGDGVRARFAESDEKTKGWTADEYGRAKQRAEELDERVLALIRTGAAPESAQTLDVMAEHYAMVAEYWTPDAASYRGLGELYVDNAAFRSRYDSVDPRLAQYLRDATAAYAEQRL